MHSYIQQVVSNSQLIVFYSTNNQITIYGNATNWNDTGFDENYQPPSKSRLKLLHTVSRCHQENVTINDHISLYIKARICGIGRYCVNFIGPLNESEYNFSETIQYFTYFSLHDNFNSTQILTRIMSGQNLNYHSLCDQGGDFA